MGRANVTIRIMIANHVEGLLGIDKPKSVFRLQLIANGNQITARMAATMANAMKNAFITVLEELR